MDVQYNTHIDDVVYVLHAEFDICLLRYSRNLIFLVQYGDTENFMHNEFYLPEIDVVVRTRDGRELN